MTVPNTVIRAVHDSRHHDAQLLDRISAPQALECHNSSFHCCDFCHHCHMSSCRGLEACCSLHTAAQYSVLLSLSLPKSNTCQDEVKWCFSSCFYHIDMQWCRNCQKQKGKDSAQCRAGQLGRQHKAVTASLAPSTSELWSARRAEWRAQCPKQLVLGVRSEAHCAQVPLDAAVAAIKVVQSLRHGLCRRLCKLHSVQPG